MYHFLHRAGIVSVPFQIVLGKDLKLTQLPKCCNLGKQFSFTHEQPKSCAFVTCHLDFRSTGSVCSSSENIPLLFSLLFFCHHSEFCREKQIVWIYCASVSTDRRTRWRWWREDALKMMLSAEDIKSNWAEDKKCQDNSISFLLD